MPVSIPASKAVHLLHACVAKTFGGPNDWRVGPITTFFQGRQPVPRRGQRRVVAVSLARQQPEFVLESAGIRNLRPMCARLRGARGISRGERRLSVGGICLWMGLAKRDSFGIPLHVECGNSGLDDSNSAGCALRVLVRGSLGR
jgi:hypothetical protein